jgi:gliding motility-associated lipoprotein GldD
MKRNNSKILNFEFRSIPARALATICLFSLVCSLNSCGDDDDPIAPKPHAYFRLNFPEKKYVPYNSDCPFTFEMPSYARMLRDTNPGAEPCWLNMDFPSLHGTLHLSYKEIKNGVQGYLDDTYTLASKHQVKASGIEEKLVSRDSSKVYGLIYEIGGNAASSVQFFLTDSTKHFIRGALYFNAVPNTDSLSPVVDFVRKDIYHMIETFEWKDKGLKP